LFGKQKLSKSNLFKLLLFIIIICLQSYGFLTRGVRINLPVSKVSIDLRISYFINFIIVILLVQGTKKYCKFVSEKKRFLIRYLIKVHTLVWIGLFSYVFGSFAKFDLSMLFVWIVIHKLIWIGIRTVKK